VAHVVDAKVVTAHVGNTEFLSCILKP